MIRPAARSASSHDDSRIALARDLALAARLRVVLAPTAALYEGDPAELIVGAFLAPTSTR